MAEGVGFEPTEVLPSTVFGTVAFIRSANPLKMERATGIDPASEAWKAPVLPLNYARMDADIGVAPTYHGL